MRSISRNHLNNLVGIRSVVPVELTSLSTGSLTLSFKYSILVCIHTFQWFLRCSTLDLCRGRVTIRYDDSKKLKYGPVVVNEEAEHGMTFTNMFQSESSY